MLVMGWIQAGAAEPVAALRIAQSDEAVAHRPQQSWIELAVRCTMGCLDGVIGQPVVVLSDRGSSGSKAASG